MEKKWLSVPEFAAKIEKSVQYVRRMIDKGKIADHSVRRKKVGTKGRAKITVNYKTALADIGENLSRRMPSAKVEKEDPPQPQKSSSGSLADAQRITAQYKAALTKLDYDKKSGKLIEAEAANNYAFTFFRVLRDAFLNIPVKISAELASITSTHEINELLIKEFNEVLEGLSEWRLPQ